MKFYTNTRGDWETRQADCDPALGPWERVDLPDDSPGMLALLKSHRWRTSAEAGQGAADPAPRGDSYAARSVAIEDAWDALPLARQLHFAALAMERARESLP